MLIGDIWVGSGQSNMEWPVKSVVNAQTEIASANHPRIRLFRVKNNVADYPLDDADASGWNLCAPATVADFSAVAYFFGRHLERKSLCQSASSKAREAEHPQTLGPASGRSHRTLR
ncbi:MAG: hypothetical protein WKF84_18455 [Pyrinomonadaceae bacterium]